jgi:hypothetical protein
VKDSAEWDREEIPSCDDGISRSICRPWNPSNTMQIIACLYQTSLLIRAMKGNKYVVLPSCMRDIHGRSDQPDTVLRRSCAGPQAVEMKMEMEEQGTRGSNTNGLCVACGSRRGLTIGREF